MTLIEKFRNITSTKFSFAKSSEYSEVFARDCNALSMYDPGFGLNIPPNLSAENKLWGVFNQTKLVNGIFLFNISGVNLRKGKKGFKNYEEAEYNNQITEWELSIILANKDYLKNCIFHNGKVQFKKTILWRSIM
jgi:hypothetical protein